MLTIHSPKFSASGRAEFMSNKMSPSFRNKRIPSALDNYSCENNNVKLSKNQSPSKLSEECARRKSQLGENNPNKANSLKKSKEKNPQNIIQSIHCLKEEYKILKQAYKELIQQKLKNSQEIAKYKSQLSISKAENERIGKENQKIKIQLICLEQENQRVRRECYKLLEVEKFKAKKLEESLLEKQEYINRTLYKIRTEGDESFANARRTLNQSMLGDLRTVEEQSLTLSQDKSAQLFEKEKANNQSQFLSFSLTSILQESTYKQSAKSQKREHTKIVSELTLPTQEEDIRITEVKSAKNKDSLMNPFKKPKKQVSRLDLQGQNRESKQNLILTHLSNLVNPRGLPGFEKKSSKNKAAKSFRQKGQQKQNIAQLKNNKKKSKKLINLSSNQ